MHSQATVSARLVLEVGQAILSAGGNEAALADILTAALRFSGADTAGLVEVDPAGGPPRWLASIGPDAERLECSPRGAGSVWRAIQSGELSGGQTPNGAADRSGVGRTELAAPLRVLSEVRGVLVVSRRGRRRFRLAAADLLRVVATLAAVALENAALIEAEQQRRRQLEAVLRSTHSVMAATDLDEMLRRIVEEAGLIAGGAEVELVLVGAGGAELRSVARSGATPLNWSPGTALYEYARTVVQRGESLFVPSRAPEPGPERAPGGRAEFGTFLGIPARAGDQVVGILALVTGSSRNYRDDELNYLAVFADQAVIAVEHARLLAAALEAARLKGQFVSNMSHELRTPLNGVIGMTELLLGSGLTSAQHECAETIRTSGTALLAIVNDILDFASLEAGRLALEIADFDLAAEVGQVVQSFAGSARSKGVALRCRLDPALPSGLLGDPARLRQVLTKLLDNAVKFTERGLIELTAELEWSGPERALVRFTVADTGVGITADQQPGLYEAFSQVDGSTTRRHGGTGLGLALTNRLVGLMGGRLEVTSEPGQGSSFGFSLPFQLSAPASAWPARSAEPGADWPILLVDDNPVNRKVAQRLIERLGYRVELAANGREAVERMARARYAAVLMDCQMPEMDGFQATALIRLGEAGGRRTPIIAMTAAALVGDRDHCLAADMDDYVSKPASLEQLHALLARWTTAAGAVPQPAAPAAECNASAC
jgi:signal transduction histidine kinase/CheY-like chemotaxis protein